MEDRSGGCYALVKSPPNSVVPVLGSLTMSSKLSFRHFADLRQRGPLKVLLAALLACLGAFAATSSQASATSYAYSELARFGGFDASAYNDAHYGGSLTPGKFVDPTGFTVDSADSSAPDDTAIYVVDRTSNTLASTTSWRLQKLSDTGTVLGVTTFTLPNEPAVSRSAIFGLAVDDTAGRVYALVVGNGEDGESQTPFAKEVLAWSIHPEAGKLVAAKEGASALPSDSLGSTGGLISTEAKLTQNGVMYVPQGIALDVTGGHRDLNRGQQRYHRRKNRSIGCAWCGACAAGEHRRRQQSATTSNGRRRTKAEPSPPARTKPRRLASRPTRMAASTSWSARSWVRSATSRHSS